MVGTLWCPSLDNDPRVFQHRTALSTPTNDQHGSSAIGAFRIAGDHRCALLRLRIPARPTPFDGLRLLPADRLVKQEHVSPPIVRTGLSEVIGS
jgi:hypothetical protein